MLMPKITKYRKQQNGVNRGIARRGNTLNFAEFGLFAEEAGHIKARQIEAARIAIMRDIKRSGKLWIRIFPDKPVTRKAAETRMGKGKGDIDCWVAVIKPGRCLFELGGVAEATARAALRLAGHKLPMRTRFRGREN